MTATALLQAFDSGEVTCEDAMRALRTSDGRRRALQLRRGGVLRRGHGGGAARRCAAEVGQMGPKRYASPGRSLLREGSILPVRLRLDDGNGMRCFDPQSADALLVDLLRSRGAIPFVRTTTPQSLLVPGVTTRFGDGQPIRTIERGHLEEAAAGKVPSSERGVLPWASVVTLGEV